MMLGSSVVELAHVPFMYIFFSLEKKKSCYGFCCHTLMSQEYLSLELSSV